MKLWKLPFQLNWKYLKGWKYDDFLVVQPKNRYDVWKYENPKRNVRYENIKTYFLSDPI